MGEDEKAFLCDFTLNSSFKTSLQLFRETLSDTLCFLSATYHPALSPEAVLSLYLIILLRAKRTTVLLKT